MAKVRGNGSVIQIDKSKKTSEKQAWELRVNVGRNLSTNKYSPMTRRFHGTLTDAKKALREFIAEIERGEVQRKSNMKFGDYCDAWIEERKGKVRRTTAVKEENRLKCFKMHLKEAKLSEITPSVLEDVYQKLLDGDSPSGKKLNPNTVAGSATTLHGLFRDAIKDGHIASNPCDTAQRPRIETKERKSIRAADIKKLLEKLDRDNPMQLVIVIALKTGMRRGEIHGLSWGDVDLDNKVIHVRHNYTELGELEAPKTTNGYRDIPITESLIDDLEIRLEYQEDIAMEYGVEIDESTPIISTDKFERLLPHVSTRWWTRNRAEMGFPDLSIHELRHSFLTEMARRKVDPKVLQKLAGHAKYSTTMDIYTHVDMEDKRDAMKKMDW